MKFAKETHAKIKKNQQINVLHSHFMLDIYVHSDIDNDLTQLIGGSAC